MIDHVGAVGMDFTYSDTFHVAALTERTRENGAPCLHTHFHPNYDGPFVLDTDGHNLGAVCYLPQEASH